MSRRAAAAGRGGGAPGARRVRPCPLTQFLKVALLKLEGGRKGGREGGRDE